MTMLSGCSTLIEEADDVDPEKMKARLSYSRLDQLGSFLGRKASVPCITVSSAWWRRKVALGGATWRSPST